VVATFDAFENGLTADLEQFGQNGNDWLLELT